MKDAAQTVTGTEAGTAPDWYRDAVIYQLHVKAYQDANGDGMGDFKGLMQRLDHVEELGATAVWILPFYPSPLRDDGYDIAEYKAVNPQYGTMEDFQGFVDEAHRRGLKVITELVINHTSDQHEWFQRARHAPKGSPERDFYVWSDDPRKWMDKTRVIFNDTHDSNWSWDPVAQQFYWHRFFDHQPDLNFDNPAVLEAVLDVMHFWLDKGVDGLRLDAIPYLVERDGTNNENLPETHDVLKAIRADLDKHYEGKMLLAEANQWPEDTLPYFGDGDECHMGFNFPLMPRMYMAVAQEDRHPVTDIIRQTPEPPKGCQWAIFLRNHDELTLEMVTDRERDYLWNTYAADKRARINMGIRRRLAPLMQNDRRKIELMNSMLLSMPGTPVLYYGDEIGMGDNYYLGDRDGVRTPMQWSGDRNAGFSRAVPQKLYLPTIQDPVFGYEAVNVDAQADSPSSLLNWMRRMVGVRGRYDVFGRGEIDLLYPRNRQVLAYVRRREGVEAGDEADGAVLCVANLSRSAQAVEVDLSRWKGRVPVELVGRAAFPPVGDLPYLLTLPAYGFYWFELAGTEAMPDWYTPTSAILPEFATVTVRDGALAPALRGRDNSLVRASLPEWLNLQRWYAGKGAEGEAQVNVLAETGPGQALTVVEAGGESYVLPLAILWGEENVQPGAAALWATVAKVRQANRVGALIDGTADDATLRGLMDRLRAGGEVEAAEGRLAFLPAPALADVEDGEPRRLGVEQSNVSVVYGEGAILKLYRRVREGDQPDVEVARFLTDAGWDGTPRLLGTIDWQRGSGDVTLAAAFDWVPNQGDAWGWTLNTLGQTLDAGGGDSAPQSFDLAETLGRRTGEMHAALASGAEGSAFASKPLDDAIVEGWAADARADLARAMDRISSAGLSGEAGGMAERLHAARGDLEARIDAAAKAAGGGRASRIHGDYHLGQVLVTQGDVRVIDFEGEPSRSIDERRALSHPMRDVAGMLRSFDYAAQTAARRRIDGGGDAEAAEAAAEAWRDRTSDDFLAAWRDASGIEGMDALLDLFRIQKAAYEVDYELSFRPGWVDIPLAGLLRIAEGRA